MRSCQRATGRLPFLVVVCLRADGEPVNYLCADYRSFFRHVRPATNAMAELLSRGRPASDVMAPLADGRVDLDAQLARSGRNDPCPCGSGLKVKRCHGREA